MPLYIMKGKFIKTDLVQCIENVIQKNRASLTVKEEEMLEEIKMLLMKIDEGVNIDEKKVLTLKIVFHFIRLLANPDVFEKNNEAFHHSSSSL